MEATSIDALVEHCTSAQFTGILRIRAHEGIGEVWFLSGITDEVHFGVSKADEAMARMRKATQATFELVSQLPHPAGGFKRRFPSKGSVATATPVTLMRYCEQYVLTCTLAVESKGVLVEATYALGELVKVETTADDDGITAMLEAQEGTYEFLLPRVDLPAGTPVLPPAPSLLDLLPPESLRFRAMLDAKPAVGRPASDEAEVKRKTIEVAHRQKKSVTTPTASAPVAAARPAAEKREGKAVAVEPSASPKDEGRDAEKREAEKREAEKREAEKREVEQLKAERRQAEAREAEKRDGERAPPDEDIPAEQAKPSASTELGPEVPPPPAGSWTWVVVPLLLLAALGYLFWTHRF